MNSFILQNTICTKGQKSRHDIAAIGYSFAAYKQHENIQKDIQDQPENREKDRKMQLTPVETVKYY